MKKILTLICLTFLLSLPLSVFGQDGFFRLFEPMTGNKKASVTGGGSLNTRERVKDQETGLEDSRWENDQYYRAEREDKDDRLFWYEKRLEAGIKLRSAGDLEVVLSGGYSFDRFFFEGESYDDDRTDNRVDVGNGPFIAVRAGIKL
jgi:hypothetical protein